MEKKQTALDYFVKKLEMMKVNNLSEFYNEIEIAKQMEKEQMKDLYLSHVTKAERLRKIFEKQFEQYYNETFGGENE